MQSLARARMNLIVATMIGLGLALCASCIDAQGAGDLVLQPEDFVLQLKSIPMSTETLTDLEKGQIQFNQKAWDSDKGARCRMIVNLLRCRRLKDSRRTAIEGILGEPWSGSSASDCCSYSLHYGMRCGNQPQLYLEVQYKKERVFKYRAAYWADGGTYVEQVTPWVQ